MTPTNEELLPCPFCKNAAARRVLSTLELGYTENYVNFTVCCDVFRGGCGACAGYAGTTTKAVQQWNTRAELSRRKPVQTLPTGDVQVPAELVGDWITEWNELDRAGTKPLLPVYEYIANKAAQWALGRQ